MTRPVRRWTAATALRPRIEKYKQQYRDIEKPMQAEVQHLLDDVRGRAGQLAPALKLKGTDGKAMLTLLSKLDFIGRRN